MEANYIVVRFGELTTKGKNRKLFTQKLLKNAKEILFEEIRGSLSINSPKRF
mgnify:CR=1 FL=1